MKPSGGDPSALLAGVQPARRRDDALVLVDLLREVSSREPVLWGTIIGFGACRYRYPTGTEGESPLLSFAPRKASTTLYLLDGAGAHAAALAELGPHTTGAGCLYIPRLAEVDLEVLRGILRRSLVWAEAGGADGMSVEVTG
ncbi:DUF1801 domain-containing protein [Microbacterium gilvum]|uniref:YdhG-like domain-containing protein n=1 Tax=Microbacterium gilvum TaxID=1336204 RepID=A0ABP9AMK4_9MICO